MMPNEAYTVKNGRLMKCDTPCITVRAHNIQDPSEMLFVEDSTDKNIHISMKNLRVNAPSSFSQY